MGHVIGVTSQVTRSWPPDHVCDGSPDSVKFGAEIGWFRAHDERGIAKIGHLTLDKDIERTYPSRPSTTPDRSPASPARSLASAALCSSPTVRVRAQSRLHSMGAEPGSPYYVSGALRSRSALGRRPEIEQIPRVVGASALAARSRGLAGLWLRVNLGSRAATRCRRPSDEASDVRARRGLGRPRRAIGLVRGLHALH
jgi:hypothetical protein